ncbi:porin family protein [Sphingomonas sp. ABOLG]|jgi:outer membrane immunogenic protein|uniref:Porin family protein n=1 Tax=Sphingomonas olei TaxID=1886787 RepID=A0ABY2QKY1_9SPHN|nr:MULTISPECIES: outer membrane beta-barrel protein [Sphingomonas]RSV17650.1 porin family protein [Sphingomonas sp. ABOLG]THG41375.1 porin family protein [Sphingomonas olei]
MKSLFLAGIAAALVAPSIASAQTADEDGFSGVYIGAAGGYDVQPNDRGSSILFDTNLDGRFGDAVNTAAGANAFAPPVGGFCNGRALAGTSPTNPTSPAACAKDKDGWAYYGRIGYDYQRGGLVLGAVGEFGKSEITDSVSAFSSTPASYVMTRSIDWEASIRGRVGYTPNNRTLFYGTFGPGYARIDREFSTTNAVNGFSESGKRNHWGITGGGGIEQKVANNVSLGLEYMYHQYKDDDYRVRAGNAGDTAASNPFLLVNGSGTDFRRSDDKFRWHSIRATAAYRF